MRNNVSFRHPAEFVPLSEEDGILAVSGSGWFVELLKRIPDLTIDAELCQEDWGVVAFVTRNDKRFWVGLSMWPDGDHAWLAHLHHRSFAWLQRFSKSGRVELQQLVVELHKVLAGDRAVSDINWYLEQNVRKANPAGTPEPVGG